MQKKKNPYENMMRTDDEMSRMLDFFRHGWQGDNEKMFIPDLRRDSIPEMRAKMFKSPLTDMYETEKEVIAKVEMPGIDKKDVTINVLDDGLEIKAEKKTEMEQSDKKSGFYRFERNYGGMYRKLPLPRNVDANMAVANLKDGVLEIRMPKLMIEEKKRKQIEVK